MMSKSTGSEKSIYVHGIFSRIAKRYDLINRLMTAGQDIRWRREAIQSLKLRSGTHLLDLGAGTGDLGREALHQQPNTHLVSADFNLDMILSGLNSEPLQWVNADALRLPFPDRSFDAIVSGFLMRNVGSLNSALLEQYRVLKPDGRVIILETTRRHAGIFSPFVWIYMHLVIPLVGGIVSGDWDAYRYLPASSESFLDAEELAIQVTFAGFKKVGFRRLMFGTIAIHWGEKD
jgi:demethylmenaquinone methyltransferase/2-methoxy-6-polyprenyl-1,4-benzoquinol methylase